MIDINCDLGEGLDNEHIIMPLISSCNISCGAHAGSIEIMDKVIQLAVQHKVKIGAHPSFPDKQNFGRKVLDISNINSPEEITTIPMTSPYGMTMINNKLYVGEGVNGMAIFDATDPANPILINSNTSIVAYDVIEHPSIPNRILTTSDFGLSQYEVNSVTSETIFLSEIAY